MAAAIQQKSGISLIHLGESNHPTRLESCILAMVTNLIAMAPNLIQKSCDILAPCLLRQKDVEILKIPFSLFFMKQVGITNSRRTRLSCDLLVVFLSMSPPWAEAPPLKPRPSVY